METLQDPSAVAPVMNMPEVKPAVKSLAATSSPIHTGQREKILSTCFSREQKA